MEEKKSSFEGENSKKKFKNLCAEMLPLILEMKEVLQRNGVNTMSSVTFGEDEYFNFDVHGSRWTMTRCDNGPTNIRYGFCEEIEIEWPK